MLSDNLNNLFVIVVIGVISILFISTMFNSFFWDTVQLGSKHATYYLSTDFRSILLPSEIDSGHIPVFGIYLAFIWKCFGRSLLVSHLAMLPFVIGIVYQLYLLVKHYIDIKYVGLVFLLVIFDPTLLSQMTLVSPDIPLVYFFLLSWYAVIKNRPLLLIIGVLCLFLISMRGMMISLCLLIVDIYTNIKFNQRPKDVLWALVIRSILYLPAFMTFVFFAYYHYREVGWFGFHASSPWAESFKSVGLNGLLKNVIVLCWRLVDFGRVGIWFVMFVLFIKYRKNLLSDKRLLPIGVLYTCFLVLLPLNMIWAENLLGHRYLLPLYLIFALATAKALSADYVQHSLRKLLISIWAIVLITGNFWVYPPKISQGWDATLAHLPYYRLRHDAIHYLNQKSIDVNDVATFFPNKANIDFIDLNGSQDAFKQFEVGVEYVLYSNVYNIDDHTIDVLKREYDSIRKFESMTVFVSILRRKNL